MVFIRHVVHPKAVCVRVSLLRAIVLYGFRKANRNGGRRKRDANKCTCTDTHLTHTDTHLPFHGLALAHGGKFANSSELQTNVCEKCVSVHAHLFAFRVSVHAHLFAYHVGTGRGRGRAKVGQIRTHAQAGQQPSRNKRTIAFLRSLY